jgi:hypothetical protein
LVAYNSIFVAPTLGDGIHCEAVSDRRARDKLENSSRASHL